MNSIGVERQRSDVIIYDSALSSASEWEERYLSTLAPKARAP